MPANIITLPSPRTAAEDMYAAAKRQKNDESLQQNGISESLHVMKRTSEAVRDTITETENLKPRRETIKTYSRMVKASIALSEKTGNNKINALPLKESSQLSKPRSVIRHDSLKEQEDSDDDMPLFYQLSKCKAINGLHTETVGVETAHNLSNCHSKLESLDDSDDDKPLAYKVPIKPFMKIKTKDSHDDLEDNSPLAFIRQANGPATAAFNGKTSVSAATVATKRPIDETKVVQSAHPVMKNSEEDGAQVKTAAETDIYNDEDIPLAHCSWRTSKNINAVAKKRAAADRVSLGSASKKLKEAIAQVNAAAEIEVDNDNEDDIPLIQQFGKTCGNVDLVAKRRLVEERVGISGDSASKRVKEAIVVTASEAEIDDDDEDDIPLAQYSRKSSGNVAVVAKKRPVEKKVGESGDSTSKKLKEAIHQVKAEAQTEIDDDDVPLAQHFSVVTKIKKPIMPKKSSSTSKTTMAVKKVLNARKAKLNQKNEKLNRKKRNAKVLKTAPGAGGGQKWSTLEHNGVIFPPPYTPHGVKMLYEGKPVELSPEEEEVATMFAVMRDTEYVTKPKFLANFWNDWKKILRPGHVIKSLEGCDFTPIYQWHLAEKEKKKQITSKEKKRLKEEKVKQEEQYMWALVDGVKEKVGNFRVEPPGLFRGRGEHPKMGKLKRRILPEDITINIGEDAPMPVCPVPGHRWKEIRYDNTVTWLAFWNDPINVKECKYVFLAASSSLKGQSDKEKHEKARKLKDYIGDIRETYTKNFTSSDETTRQIAVATYLIDRLALRAGNEKDDDEADTVGCCSLKVDHVTLIPPSSLEFDFLGKDSIRYNNIVEVEAPVYKAIGDFKKSKREGQDLFDMLDTTKLNAHLKEIMPGLTAKVFRTYNASITLDTLLINTSGHIVAEKVASYNTANKEVAVLCNHQRSVSKTHGAQMEKLEGKMTELEALLQELRNDLDSARKGRPPLNDADGKTKRNQTPEALQRRIMQTTQKVEKMKLEMRLKDDLKTVALGTSKINYLDPRITVAWCKRHEVPIEKIFNKSLLAKFAWAMDADMEFRF